MELKEMIEGLDYDFLRTNEHLGNRLILLGMGGSISYGTNQDTSDIDVRGIAVCGKKELLGLSHFEQYIDEQTDTVIYAFQKLIRLLMECNPNTIELLGLKPDHYLYMSPLGQELLDIRKLFLSKRAVHSFGGYADQQLRRLQNALSRDSMAQSEKEQHIFRSVTNAMHNFMQSYQNFDNGSMRIYVDKAVNAQMETEIFLDADLKHYPLRDYLNIWSEMNNVVKEYNKIGKRNKKKDNSHLNKHAMHLIRLFFMALDILEKEEINTYREAEQPLLMSIRRGEFQKPDGSYRDEFYELLSDCERRLAYAAEHTSLPDKPDEKRIEEFVVHVNEEALKL